MKDCCTCIHEYRHPMSEVCRECGIAMLNYEERTPALTNADRIRGMSDEELAEFLATCEIKAYERTGHKGDLERFKKQWLSWLQCKMPLGGNVGMIREWQRKPQGETLTLTQWSERFGISKTTLKERLNSGWTIEDALIKPVRPRGAKMGGEG